MIKTSTVDPHMVQTIWHMVEPMLTEACAYSDNLTSADIYNRCTQEPDTHRLFVVLKEDKLVGVIAYELHEDKLVQLSTTYHGLDKADVLSLMDSIKQLAKTAKVKSIVGKGRRGWSKYTKSLGWITHPDGTFEYKMEETQ